MGTKRRTSPNVISVRNHRSTHSDTDGLDHSDHRNAIRAKKERARSARQASSRQDPGAPALARRPRVVSSTPLPSTSAPNRLQYRKSGDVSRNEPRSQNHWYACRNQVTAKATDIEATSLGVGFSARSRT